MSEVKNDKDLVMRFSQLAIISKSKECVRAKRDTDLFITFSQFFLVHLKQQNKTQITNENQISRKKKRKNEANQ